MAEVTLAEAARVMSQHRKQVTKRCERCGREFVGLIFQRYCCSDCRLKAAYHRYYERYRKKPVEGEKH